MGISGSKPMTKAKGNSRIIVMFFFVPDRRIKLGQEERSGFTRGAPEASVEEIGYGSDK
jgi:hypothetical protein